MLPQDRHQDKDTGNEDDGECNLRDGSAGKRLDLAHTVLRILLLVPSGEGGQKQEADEGEDDGDNDQVRKHDHVLELRCQPNQVERILVHGNLVGEGSRIVGAEPRSTVRVDANTKVAYTCLKMGRANNVANGLVAIVVDLCSVGRRRVVRVVQREQENVWYQRRG